MQPLRRAGGRLQSFQLGDVAEAGEDDGLGQRLEAKLGATGRDRGDDAADVVADEAEPGRAGLLLHGATQGRLGGVRHRIRLVEDDQLVRRTRLPTDGLVKDHFSETGNFTHQAPPHGLDNETLTEPRAQ